MNTKRLIFRTIRWSTLQAIVRGLIQRRRVTIVLYNDPAPETLRKHLRILKSKYNYSVANLPGCHQGRHHFHTAS